MINQKVNSPIVNTSESYSSLFFLGQNNVVIPYINLDIISDGSAKEFRHFVNYCFYVFMDVKKIHMQSSVLNIELEFNPNNYNSNNISIEYIKIGGYKSSEADVKILYNSATIFFPVNCTYSELQSSFIPENTPNFIRTMSEVEVETFFSYENLPSELKDHLGSEFIKFSLPINS